MISSSIYICMYVPVRLILNPPLIISNLLRVTINILGSLYTVSCFWALAICLHWSHFHPISLLSVSMSVYCWRACSSDVVDSLVISRERSRNDSKLLVIVLHSLHFTWDCMYPLLSEVDVDRKIRIEKKVNYNRKRCWTFGYIILLTQRVDRWG